MYCCGCCAYAQKPLIYFYSGHYEAENQTKSNLPNNYFLRPVNSFF